MSVLGLEASHLLLIHTNLGCGTVLTAACARQGCSAEDYYYYFFIIIFITATTDTIVRTANEHNLSKLLIYLCTHMYNL
jgi:hypothetical protein